jgi:sugar phosphate isomerase/epimerase
MRIGLVTDSLGHLDRESMLDACRAMGIAALEIGCGAWSQAPHLDLDAMLASDSERRALLASIERRGLELVALNCSGNPLHPGASGTAHRAVAEKTIRLAPLLGVSRVVMMSGCPGGPGDANANWITTAWPPETAEVLAWQWRERITPFWQDLNALAEQSNVTIALELHGQQSVYNVPSLFRLREAVGARIGANLDPSHLMWMGADPAAAARALGPAIHHVHAKDTRIDPANAGLASVIDTTPMADHAHRAWSYVTLGDGHALPWWKTFLAALKSAGYDGVLSIEHEDVSCTPEEGVARSVELLRQAMA